MRCPIAIVVVCSSLLGCSAPGASASFDEPRGDGGEPTMPEVPVVESDLDVSLGADPAMRPSALATPATEVAMGSRSTPPGATPPLACRMDVPEGPCDRCPDRVCRQVRLSLSVAPAESEWAMFCDEGDLLEESEIACLCAGGSATTCERAALDTAQALLLLHTIFGGVVPPVGTRYRDAAGLRVQVDEPTHDWLAAVAGPTHVVRCDAPDRETAARTYEVLSQRVRRTGSCE